MDSIPYGAQTAFLRLLHPELERDYEQEDAPDYEDAQSIPTVRCPYCGGAGTQEWFENHSHPDPFGDED